MNINEKIKKISIIENNNSYLNEQIKNSKIFIQNIVSISNIISLNPIEYILNIINNNFNHSKFYPLYFLFKFGETNKGIQETIKEIAELIKKENLEIKLRFLKDIETNYYRIEINFTFIGFIIEHNSNYNPLFYFPKEFYINLITKSNIRKIMTNIYWDNIFFPYNSIYSYNDNINDEMNDDINENNIIETKGIQTNWLLNKIIFLNESDYLLEKLENDEILDYQDYWYKSLIRRSNVFIFIVKHDFLFKKINEKKLFNYYGHLFIFNYMKLINIFINNENNNYINILLNESNKIDDIFGEKLEYYGGEYEPYWELKEREWNRIKIESLKY
jgi:hypothetical protein